MPVTVLEAGARRCQQVTQDDHPLPGPAKRLEAYLTTEGLPLEPEGIRAFLAPSGSNLRVYSTSRWPPTSRGAGPLTATLAPGQPVKPSPVMARWEKPARRSSGGLL